MTQLTKHDLVQLLARARSVIADSGDAGLELCNDLARAERLVEIQTDICAGEAQRHEEESALHIVRLLVISTSHILPETGELLDLWARLPPGSRPLGVAEAGYGWFVLTDPLNDIDRQMIPPELAAACEFVRARGCRWLLLDQDAAEIDDLEIFDW